ncbi:Rrf2 family transcriptional regulator [Candidatus Saganbacteria bacterium]|nr:Rrf2 family transcriptional regulator [Candidatus Saganbacteria bacterium]
MINRKIDYAFRCLVYLAEQPAGTWITTAELSRELKVSRLFLAKIFQVLAKHEILEAVKGKGGGIRLKNKNISLARIINLLEPEFGLNKCLIGNFKCFRKDSCSTHKFLTKLQNELWGKLERMTLKKLAKSI